MVVSPGLKFGSFVAPYHHPRRSHALAIERDLVFTEALDRLGFSSVWFGEHHSSGWEASPAPELMIAAAAQRTKSIELCSGVISLPYHHPFIVADSMAFLDHMTRGRVNFGFGPGSLARDSEMMGMEYNNLRPRMEEALMAIIRLFDEPEPFDMKTDWFELAGAVLQTRSYTQPRTPMTVAASVSPTGPKLAGRNGLQLLSLAGTSPKAFDILGSTWEVLEYEAGEHGHTPDRSQWHIVVQMHVAETYEDAVDQTRYGLADFIDYRQAGTPLEITKPGEQVSHETLVERYNETGTGLIGDVAMAQRFIQRIVDQTGGFGTLLLLQTDWANHHDTIESLELFANEVIPSFDGRYDGRQVAFDRLARDSEDQVGRILTGMALAKETYEKERANNNS